MTRRPLTLLGIVTALIGATMIPAFAEVDPANVEGGTVDKTGWWSQANTRIDNPTGPITVPPPPGIPEDRLVVGVAGGTASTSTEDSDAATAMSAIGFLPEAERGDTLSSFTFSIDESDDPANQPGPDPAVAACPIISFWAGGENGTWDTKPEWDCEVARADGTRDDGSWTFDLSPIGRAWLDPFGTVAADGFVLVNGNEEPAAFQVLFDPSTVEVALTFEPAPDAADDPFEIPDAPTDVPGPTGNFSAPSPSTGNPSTFGGGSDVVVDSPSPSTPESAATDAPADVPTIDSEPAANRASNAGVVFGNFPGGLPFLVIAFGGILVLMGLALGPMGEPTTHTRQRGVSRALEARAAAAREAREIR